MKLASIERAEAGTPNLEDIAPKQREAL